MTETVFTAGFATSARVTVREADATDHETTTVVPLEPFGRIEHLGFWAASGNLVSAQPNADAAPVVLHAGAGSARLTAAEARVLAALLFQAAADADEAAARDDS